MAQNLSSAAVVVSALRVKTFSVLVVTLLTTVCHFNSVSEIIFLKKSFILKKKSGDDKSMKNYPACKQLTLAMDPIY